MLARCWPPARKQRERREQQTNLQACIAALTQQHCALLVDADRLHAVCERMRAGAIQDITAHVADTHAVIDVLQSASAAVHSPRAVLEPQATCTIEDAVDKLNGTARQLAQYARALAAVPHPDTCQVACAARGLLDHPLNFAFRTRAACIDVDTISGAVRGGVRTAEFRTSHVVVNGDKPLPCCNPDTNTVEFAIDVYDDAERSQHARWIDTSDILVSDNNDPSNISAWSLSGSHGAFRCRITLRRNAAQQRLQLYVLQKLVRDVIVCCEPKFAYLNTTSMADQFEFRFAQNVVRSVDGDLMAFPVWTSTRDIFIGVATFNPARFDLLNARHCPIRMQTLNDIRRVEFTPQHKMVFQEGYGVLESDVGNDIGARHWYVVRTPYWLAQRTEFSMRGSMLAIAYNQPELCVHVYDTHTHACVSTFPHRVCLVHNVAVLADERRVLLSGVGATTPRVGCVYMHDIATGVPLSRYVKSDIMAPFPFGVALADIALIFLSNDASTYIHCFFADDDCKLQLPYAGVFHAANMDDVIGAFNIAHDCVTVLCKTPPSFKPHRLKLAYY